MSAVLEAHEPSAKYLSALLPPLVKHFELMATAPRGVARLRELILILAVQGKLVPQDVNDEPASELLKRIRAEKVCQIAEGRIKRDKPLAPNREEEASIALPQGWGQVTIESLASVGSGTTPSRDNPTFFSDGSIPWVTSGETGKPFIAETAQHVTVAALAQTSLTVYPVGTLIVAMYGQGKTRGQISELQIEATTNQACAAIVLVEASPAHRSFVKLVFEKSYEEMRELSAGGAQPNLNVGKIKSTLIPLPPLAEQARIVTRVEELMRLCDALEAKGQLEAAQHAQLVQTLLGALTASATPDELADNWQRVATHFDLLLDRPEAIDALEQTILQLAVRGLLVPQDPKDEPASELLKKIRAEKDRLIAEGKIKRDKPFADIADDEKPYELPNGWSWARVGTLGITMTGGTPASSNLAFFKGDFPFIGPGQITLNGKLLRAEKFLSELGCAESAVASPGDILMVCIGGSIGKCAAATYTTAFNQQINSIAPLVASKEYVLQAMSGTDFSKAVVAASTGSATPIISKGKWDVLLLPVPPLKEQLRIVDRVESLRHLCADLRQRLAACQTTQAHLAEALIAEVA